MRQTYTSSTTTIVRYINVMRKPAGDEAAGAAKEAAAADVEYKQEVANYNALAAVQHYDFDDIDDVIGDTKIKADGHTHVKLGDVKMEEITARMMEESKTERQ